MAQWVKGLGIVTAMAWIAAETWTPSLAQELLHATDAAKKKKKNPC